MALESQNTDPKRGHTIPAVELETPIEQPSFPIDVTKLTEEQRSKILEDVRNFEKLNQMIEENNSVAEANEVSEKKQARAAAAGGGVQPPSDPTPPPNEATFDVDALEHQVRVELENAGIKRENNAIKTQLEQKLANDTVREMMAPEAPLTAAAESDNERLERMIAGNDAMIANNISQEKLINAINAQTASPEPAKDPSIIPLQTEPNPLNPAFVTLENESTLDTASRWSNKAAEYVGDKVATSMQYGILGKLEPMFERLGIRLLNGTRRKVLEGMYKWRSEHAFMANEELKKAEQLVAEKEKALAEQDAKRDTFLAEEKKNGWLLGSTAIKLESERAKAVKRIEAAKQDRDAKKAKLEGWNTKKTHWENMQKDVARNMVSKINLSPKLVHANADFLALTKHKENITNQLAQWDAARTKATEKLAQLEAKLKSDIGYAEEVELVGQIEEIQKILAEGNKKYKEYVGKKNAANSKMGKINTYLSGWNTFKNELGRTGENNRYDNPGEQVKVNVGADRTPTQSHAPRA